MQFLCQVILEEVSHKKYIFKWTIRQIVDAKNIRKTREKHGI